MQNNKMNYIQCIAQQESILKASQILYVTPSALSKYVQKIERDLGVCLFDRIGKKFVLTYAGERYLHWIKSISAIENDMISEFNDIAGQKNGRLRIGVQLSGVDTLLYDILPAFHAQFPKIKIELYEDTSNNLRRLMNDTSIDYAILPNNQLNSDFIHFNLGTNSRVLVVTQDNFLVNEATIQRDFHYPWIDIRKAEEYRFIAPFPDQDAYRDYEDINNIYGFKPNIIIQTRSFGTMLKGVKNGLGITISREQLVYANKDFGTLKLLSFGEPERIQNLVIATHKHHYIDDAAKKFIELCKSCYYRSYLTD